MTMRRVALLALLPLALAGCDSKMLSNLPGFGKSEAPTAATPAAPGAPEAPRAPAVSPLEVPIEIAGGQRTTLGTANAAFVNVTAFTASGNGWLGAVRGNNAAIRRPGAKDAQVNVRRVDFGQGTEFVGTYGSSTASINLRAAECRDASGRVWPMSATLRLSGSKLAGCAAPAGAEPKGFAADLPVPKAVAAPAPQKAAPKKAAPKKAAPKKAATSTTTTTTTTTTPAAPATSTPAATPATTPTPTTPAPTPAPTPVEPATTAPATSTPAPATPAPTAAPAPTTTPAPATPAPTTPAPAATAPATATPAPAATTAPATGSTTTTAPVVIPPAN